MRLLFSGEGPTDLGVVRPIQGGSEFVPGPMAVVVDQLLAGRFGFSVLDTHASGADCVDCLDKTELAQAAKPGTTLLPGVKHGKGNAFFTRNAQVLGLKAIATAKTHDSPVIAVLFRDGDGTRSVDRGEWQEKVDSIKRGFQLVDFQCGVPMVPRPKSEAWLLCALKSQPYQACNALEDAPGNDDSPNALKARLAAVLGRPATAADQTQWVAEGKVDPARIDMPSFHAFKAELDRAATAALRTSQM